MYSVSHQEHCGEYRYCPEHEAEVVSLRGQSSWQDGLRFSVKGTKIRVGIFIRIAVMLGRRVRNRIVKVCRRHVLTGTGYSSQAIRRAICCARL